MAARAFSAPSPAQRGLSAAAANTGGSRYPLVAIVRGIQVRDEHDPCFRTESRYECMEFGCRWRKDCLHLVAEWFR